MAAPAAARVAGLENRGEVLLQRGAEGGEVEVVGVVAIGVLEL
jgi:hypothetical protein